MTIPTTEQEDLGADAASEAPTPGAQGRHTLDTSGFVFGPLDGERFGWSDLDPFTQGYVEALMLTLFERFENRAGKVGKAAIRDALAFDNLAPEALTKIMEITCPDKGGWHHQTSANMGYSGDAEGGRKFWSDQQAGMWAGWPPLTPYLADDGKVRLREAGPTPQSLKAQP